MIVATLIIDYLYKVRNNNTSVQQQKNVRGVYLEGNGDILLLTVERKDETKYSVVLRDPAERADKNYFIVLIPKSTSISDSAIAQLESSKT